MYHPVMAVADSLNEAFDAILITRVKRVENALLMYRDETNAKHVVSLNVFKLIWDERVSALQSSFHFFVVLKYLNQFQQVSIFYIKWGGVKNANSMLTTLCTYLCSFYNFIFFLFMLDCLYSFRFSHKIQ